VSIGYLTRFEKNEITTIIIIIIITIIIFISSTISCKKITIGEQENKAKLNCTKRCPFLDDR